MVRSSGIISEEHSNEESRHTSVVVFGKEIYYGPYNAGPGIQITSPGRSHVSFTKASNSQLAY